ncbi:MAG: CotH kinase family protein [Dehalococcoidia bacterium]
MKKAVLGLIATFLFVSLIGAGCEVRDIERGNSVDDGAFVPGRVVEVRILMKAEQWQNLLSRAKEKEYKKADIWFGDELIQDVAVRAKGSSSLKYVVEGGSKRISLKVDFDKLNKFLSYRGLIKINFHNNYRDPTLMRERLAYELFGTMEVPAPRATHVNLWVNDMHMGLYTQVEQVDSVFLRRHFGRNDGKLYKPIPSGSYLNWSGMQASLMDDMRPRLNERPVDHSTLLRLLDVLNNEPDETFPGEIEKVLYVDEALRFLAVQTVLVNLDSYLGRGLNYYLYEIDGRFVMIPWDLNEAFGTYKCGLGKEEIIDFYIDEPTCGPVEERPIADRLLSHPPYLETYYSYLDEIINGPFSPGDMEERIDEIAAIIRPYVEQDEMKFYTTDEFETNLGDDVGRYFGLKSFVEKRGESVAGQLSGELPSAGEASGNAGDPDKP